MNRSIDQRQEQFHEIYFRDGHTLSFGLSHRLLLLRNRFESFDRPKISFEGFDSDFEGADRVRERERGIVS